MVAGLTLKSNLLKHGLHALQANLDMLGGDSDAATPPVYQGKLITAKTILSYKRNK